MKNERPDIFQLTTASRPTAARERLWGNVKGYGRATAAEARR